MRHVTPPFPNWFRRSSELFTVAVAPGHSFSVSKDGDIWWLCLPGKGLRQCDSMEACEQMALDFVLTADHSDEDDEPELDDRAYGDRRFQDAKYRLGRVL